MQLLLSFFVLGCSNNVRNEIETDKVAAIFPEYYELVIPKNIAPLNFMIKENGSKFRVEISADKSNPIVIEQSSPTIQIPVNKWQKMLAKNAGDSIKINVWVFDKNWIKYKPIKHKISTDTIDPFLAYRLVHAVYLKWNKMGIYQRNLTNFDETPIIENSSIDNGCVNCHSFANNDPSKMLMHFRIIHSGTVIWNENELSKINTSSPKTVSAGIYPAWHPNGKIIAFTTGKISPHLTTRSGKVVDVADRVSDIIIYNIEKNTVITLPKLSTDKRENMPVWSPDGKWLYFTSAPKAIPGDDESLLHSKYSLMRISYNAQLNSWGEPEMIIDAQEINKSISMPSISPDGKYMICAMSDYGYFTIFHKGSDLYSVNLETLDYKKLEINSNSAESYSKWSSNGRWLVFSSKRIDDVLTRPFIAYIDNNGNAETPFVLPQKDPESYDMLLANYNRPELITGKVELSPIEIRDIVLSEAKPVKKDN